MDAWLTDIVESQTGDSTDGPRRPGPYPQGRSYPVDSADGFVDSTDATRCYPQDSTDQANNSQQIPFD
jgi:hypothetical protein